jgi:hypothetical protein
MTIENFGQLKTSVADFLNRDDLTAVVPAFVKLAEASFNRRIRSHRQITRASITIDAQFEALPADWLETIRLTMDANPVRVLTQISMDDLTRYRTERADTTDAPAYFAHNGLDIELFPRPSDSYTGEITYFARITSLADDADANWLLTNHPDAYLYGALVHSAPYLKDDPRLTVWAALLQNAMDEIELESAGARYGSPLRMRIKANG